MRTLRLGSKGKDVGHWQNFLLAKNLYTGVVDNDFGPKTDNSTRQFQAKRYPSTIILKDDGVVGNSTYGKAMVLGFQIFIDVGDTEKSGAMWPPIPEFRPLVGQAARQRVFGKFKYEPAPTSRNPEAIKILDNWSRTNIVKIHIPQLVGVRGAPKSGNIYFHQSAEKQIVKLFKDWEKAKLSHLVLSWAGTWVPRFIRGSRTTLSNHAFGTAFDINVPWNGLSHRPALVGQKGSVRELVPIANENGFYWGGHFGYKKNGRADGMHFEVARVLG